MITAIICPEGWILSSAATGLCYRHFPQQVNWTEARRSCNESGDGGDLASVPDLGTNYFLTSLIINSSREAAWIGAFRDENDTIHWSDGSPTTYQSHIMVQSWSTKRHYLLRNSAENYGHWDQEQENCFGYNCHGYICQTPAQNPTQNSNKFLEAPFSATTTTTTSAK